MTTVGLSSRSAPSSPGVLLVDSQFRHELEASIEALRVPAAGPVLHGGGHKASILDLLSNARRSRCSVWRWRFC